MPPLSWGCPLAVANAYRYKSSSWKGGAVPGAVDASAADTVEGVTKHRTDNATTTQGIFGDGVGATVKITTTDLSLRGAANYAPLSNGALVIVREQRAEGKGAVGAADKTETYADATLVAIEEGIPINGRGTLMLTFECADPAGAAVVVHS